jgi:glucose-1-phosphate thymidylyltransferase
VYERVDNLRPSKRGELEITDLNNLYATDGRLFGALLPLHCAWLDAGTPQSLLQASEYVRSYQERTGLPSGSPEFAAFKSGLIDMRKALQIVDEMPSCPYRSMLQDALECHGN